MQLYELKIEWLFFLFAFKQINTQIDFFLKSFQVQELQISNLYVHTIEL